MKRRFEQMPHEIQARMKIPAGYVVVKGSRPPLPDDLVWSVYSYEYLRADSPEWLRSPLLDPIDDCLCVVRRANRTEFVRDVPATRVYKMQQGGLFE